jgi:hypothetical protein
VTGQLLAVAGEDSWWRRISLSLSPNFFNGRFLLAFFCVCGGTSLVSLLSPQKINNIFMLKVSFVLLSLMAPLSRLVDGIVGQTNILSDPPVSIVELLIVC